MKAHTVRKSADGHSAITADNGMGEHHRAPGPQAPSGVTGRGLRGRTRLRILAVDDDPINLRLLEAILGKEYNLRTALNAERALELFARGGYSLVFLDLHMPGLSGFDCAEQMREIERRLSLPRTPIVALTADDTPQAEALAKGCGIDAMVIKPLFRKTLLEETRRRCAAAAACALRRM